MPELHVLTFGTSGTASFLALPYWRAGAAPTRRFKVLTSHAPWRAQRGLAPFRILAGRRDTKAGRHALAGPISPRRPLFSLESLQKRCLQTFFPVDCERESTVGARYLGINLMG